MTVEHLEVLVEEPSMEAALLSLLPKILGDSVTFQIYPHQCKDELLARLPQRLLAYSRWLPEAHRVVVIVDRDGDDCLELKRRLESAARESGMSTKTLDPVRWQVLNRLAIEELEAWYFGDWQAVRKGRNRPPAPT